MSAITTNPEHCDQGTLPRLDARDWPEFQPGWVWMTGGGPGDPGLITLHALNALQQADAIVYDALVDPALLQWARPDAQLNMLASGAANRHQTSAIFR
jgi:siroheme synthase